MKEIELSKNAEQEPAITPDKQIIPENAVKDDYSYTKLLPFFDIDGEEAGNPEVQERLKFIWDYFKNDSNDPADVLWKINEIEHKIGAPEFGTRRYEKLYRYLKILDNKRVIDRELKAYEKTSLE